jgi:hypothetical protein
MDDTWLTRGLPVLDVVVGLLEEGSYAVTVADITKRTGFEPMAVARSLDALKDPYLTEYRKLATGGIPDSWFVTGVTPAARREVGQWPTAESLAERLAVAFAEAADVEQDPERKGRLRELARFLGETGKDLAAEIIAKVIMQRTGMG